MRWHRYNLSRKEEERRLAINKDSMDASIQGPEDYVKKSKERLITATRNSTGNIKMN